MTRDRVDSPAFDAYLEELRVALDAAGIPGAVQTPLPGGVLGPFVGPRR